MVVWRLLAVGLKSGAGKDGTLNIFKSSTTPWAPARKVWNQYMYNAVNVNEDLTIPEKQYDSAIRFPGNDGELGTQKIYGLLIISFNSKQC